jgi:hypothetical protein
MSVVKLRIRFAVAVLIGLTMGGVMLARASTETLADAIRARGLPANPQALINFDKPISSYAVFQNAQEFLIAYYVDDRSGATNEPLFVDRYDAAAHVWTSAKIRSGDPKVRDSFCLGSVLSIHVSASGYYLGTHLNPSAGCTIVLSRDLTVQAVLPGWDLAIFDNGTIVYHRSEVHFAPTHYAEVAVYDPARGRDLQIYPMKPYQRIRTEHIRRVSRVYSDEAWCRTHNHHCDPELFDNFIRGGVAINNTTSALAFQVAFTNTVYWSDIERWRLESFRSVRTYLQERGSGAPLSDELFMRFYEDLRKAVRFPGRAQMLRTLEGDQELFDLVSRASAQELRPNETLRAFFNALDPHWERPEIWHRLEKAIAVPPEFTEVVYVYRNITNRLPIEYREMLLSDLRAQFGSLPLQRYLEPDLLRRIFGG